MVVGEPAAWGGAGVGWHPASCHSPLSLPCPPRSSLAFPCPLSALRCRDSVDFVQQGALIALALVLVGQPESRAKPLREHINRLYGNKAAEVGNSPAWQRFECAGRLRPAGGAWG